MVSYNFSRPNSNNSNELNLREEPGRHGLSLEKNLSLHEFSFRKSSALMSLALRRSPAS